MSTALEKDNCSKYNIRLFDIFKNQESGKLCINHNNSFIKTMLYHDDMVSESFYAKFSLYQVLLKLGSINRN